MRYRNRRSWNSKQYRGSRGSSRGKILAVLAALAVIAALGAAAWHFFYRPDAAVDQPPPNPSKPAPSDAPQVTPEAGPSPLPAAPDAVKGIYISGPMAGSAALDSLLALVDETELNAVVIDVKNDEGCLTYQPESGTAAELGAYTPYISDPAELVKKLKGHGVYTIARVVAFKDPFLAKAKPELTLHGLDGRVITESSSASWVSPFEPEVWAYLEEIALDAVELGFDEVQFDYVRFPAGGSGQIDYGPAGEGKEKKDAIAGFLTEVTSLLHEKGARSSADVFGTIITNPADAEYVGQDFVQLAQIVDKICPMVYPSHYAADSFGLAVPDSQPYETIHAALGYASSSLFGFEDANCVRPWLQDFTATWVTGHITYGPEELRAQIRAVYDAGYTDWLLWNAGNLYTEDGLEKSR